MCHMENITQVLQQDISKRRVILTVAIVSLGFFMTTLDASVVNVSLPVIQRYFHESLAMTEWVITSYLLVISSVLLSFGRLSDLKGHKKLILIGFSVFTLSSVCCGLSVSLYMLIIARTFQALGGAMIMSTGPALIMNVVPAKNRGKALSSTAVSLSIALCAGPVIGGLFTSVLGWQSIFFLNVPIGVIALILAAVNMPTDHIKEHVPFDVLGSMMIFTALVLIVFPLDMTGKSGINSVLHYAMLAVGILMTIGFILWEIKSPSPLLKMSLFKNRAFTTGNLALFLAYIMQYGLAFFLPYFLEKHWMLSAAAAGELMFPLTAAMICITPISGMLADRFESRLICAAGMLITAFSVFMLCGLSAKETIIYWVIVSVIAGIGSGLFQTPNMKQIMDSVSSEDRGMASAMRSTLVSIGDVLGVAISGAIYTSSAYTYRAVFITLGFITLLAAMVSFAKGRTKAQ